VTAAADSERWLALLSDASVLFTVHHPDLEKLTNRLKVRVAPTGAVLVKQGEPAPALWVIDVGRCQVSWQPPRGAPVAVSTLEAGGLFGAGSVEEEVPAPVSIVAVEQTRLLELGGIEIREAVGPDSPVRAELDRLASQRSQHLDQLAQQARAGSQRGSVVAVYSPRGGAGKTTIAVNLAASLGRRHHGEALLLDLGLPYNHAALIANLIPNGCLALSDTADERLFQAALAEICLRHRGGMLVLPGTLKVEHSELITPELVERAIGVLDRTFTYVVVDLGVAISETALRVFERADRIVVLVTAEMAALKDTREVLQILNDVLGISAEVVTLVLNSPRPGTGLTRPDVERVLGREVDLEIPHDGPRCDLAAVTGELLVLGEAKSPIARALAAVADAISSTAPVRQSRSVGVT
jgi:pilus assembly protein CpaE